MLAITKILVLAGKMEGNLVEERFDLIRKLGEGTFANIYEGTPAGYVVDELGTGNKFALKFVESCNYSVKTIVRQLQSVAARAFYLSATGWSNRFL